MLAERLADRADRIGERAPCRTLERRVAALSSGAESAIRAGHVPVALRSPLRSRIAAISAGPCVGDDEALRADDLAEWLRRRSDLVNREPPEFRVARSSVDDDPKDGLVWAVIEPMWWALETPYEPDPRLEQASPGQRAAYALTWTESEVGNGGFEQYFWNSTGMLLDEAIAGARLVGAEEVEAVLRDAASFFPGGRAPESRAERQAGLDHLTGEESQRLARLDDRFFALLDHPTRSPSSRVESYIRGHPNEFFLPT